MTDLTLHEENLIWRTQNEPLKLIEASEWLRAASKILWNIHAGQGVELEVPATPHVPYLDAN